MFKSFILLLNVFVFFYSCSEDKMPDVSVNPNLDFEIQNRDSLLNFKVDKPWEEIGIGYINVLRTDSVWHMWYETYDGQSNNMGRTDYNGYFCYAKSKDGINWVKPNLKMTLYKNDINNNILISNDGIKNGSIHGVTVFIDSLAPPAEKFKMVYTRWIDSLSTNWVYGMVSSDGINWKDERLLIKQYSDTQTVCFNDNGVYKLYLRYWNGGAHGQGYRQIGYSESTQFNNSFSQYSPVEYFNGPDNSELHLYNNAVRKVNDSLYISFPSIFYPSEDFMQLIMAYNTTDDPTIFRFYKYEYSDIIQQKHNFRGIYSSPGLIRKNENGFWLYYNATTKGHKNHKFPDYEYQGSIKRALITIKY